MSKPALRDQPTPAQGLSSDRGRHTTPATSRPSIDQAKEAGTVSVTPPTHYRVDSMLDDEASNASQSTLSPELGPRSATPASRETSKNIRRKKSNGFVTLFSLKEPSSKALQEFANAEKEKAKQKGVKPATSSQQLPDYVPRVNSKWDGMPACASGRSLESRLANRNTHDSMTSSQFRMSLFRDMRSPEPRFSNEDAGLSPIPTRDEATSLEKRIPEEVAPAAWSAGPPAHRSTPSLQLGAVLASSPGGSVPGPASPAPPPYSKEAPVFPSRGPPSGVPSGGNVVANATPESTRPLKTQPRNFSRPFRFSQFRESFR